ncbi:MAG: MYXO-CTERM sorting domain-containing protein [Phycisphaerales bacterium]
MRLQNIVTTCVGAAALVALSGTASADVIVPLGMGWEAVLASSNVSLTVTQSTDGILHLHKEALFREIDPVTGLPEPVIITFRQVAADANTASQILIDDEMILNITGATWTGYRQILGLSNNVMFNAASLGMSVGPEFTNNTLLNSSRELLSDGGPGVANNGMWMPGAVGGLLIDINLAGQEDPVVFTLKELPVIPTPGAGVLAAAGLAALSRRRR